MNIKICFWNANGIRQHKNELEYFLIGQQIDVMLISETHLTSRSYFKINGYTLYDTKDPRGRACGGSAILIKSRLKHHLLGELREDYLQATNICVENFHQNLVISSIYSPPRFSISESQYSTFYKSLGPHFLAAGDYNAKHTFWGSRLITPKGRTLFNTISKLGLSVISSGHPTYWPTDRQKIPDTIDFGVVKGVPSDLIQVEPSLELSSDHSPTIVTIYSYQNSSPTCDLVLTTTRVNWLNYKKYLSTHCTDNVLLRTATDIDDSVREFEAIIKQAAQHATSTHRHIRYNKIYSADVERLLAEKRRVRREWQRYRSPQLKIRLKECTRQLQNVLESQKAASLQAFLEGLDATPQSDYSLWRAARGLKRPTINKPPIRTLNGDWARTDAEKGALFVTHLRKVFTPNASSDTIELPPVSGRAPILLRFNYREIENAIAGLNTNKAPGVDKMSNRMLLELPRMPRRIILFIFNAILRLHHYPTDWKISLITMIPKPGKDHTKVESYRPISLLSNLSKLFEKLLMTKLAPSLSENECIPNHQFGFRTKHSTIEQTHRLVNVVRRTFEEKKYCSALFIDVSQAFDKVWHEGLMLKIKQNLPENIHKLLESYLTERMFIVKEGNFQSAPQRIEAGVPQGSILGPTLYLIYTSDMPLNSNIHTSTFADDTAFLSIHENSHTASSLLQEYIIQLEKWLKQWRIKVNEQKCVHITFTLRRDTCPHIQINNQRIPLHSEVKYLGIHLDRRLTWKTHIEAKCTQMKLKAAQLNWLIGRNSRLSLDCKLLLYNAILKPIWCYGIQLWGTASATNIEKIQRRQNKILRTITAAPWYVKNSRIHKDLDVPMVKTVFSKHVSTYIKKLEIHPNPLARNILNYRGHIRLKRKDTLALSRIRET